MPAPTGTDHYDHHVLRDDALGSEADAALAAVAALALLGLLGLAWIAAAIA